MFKASVLVYLSSFYLHAGFSINVTKLMGHLFSHCQLLPVLRENSQFYSLKKICINANLGKACLVHFPPDVLIPCFWKQSDQLEQTESPISDWCLTRFYKYSFSGGAGGKEPICQCRRHKRHRFDPWVWKTPKRRLW